MAIPQQAPWAILLCRYQDDANDPAVTRIADLYAQWLNEFGANWLSQNLDPREAADPRTIADLYAAFFTPAGAGTYNAVRYWDEMSHGRVDISGSRVFPCTLDLTKAEAAALAQNPGGVAYQNDIFRRAKVALSQQYGANWRDYYGVAVSFQSPDYGAQGGSYDGGPGVFMDIRFVLGNGIEAWGQEMGHAFGLDHSRQDGSTADYQDMWDIMSTANAFSAPDGNYGLAGPGLNAWNMRSRQWLDESRVWKGPANKDFSETVQLRPLHRRDLTGYLGAELPGVGKDSPYIVELRVQDRWDAAIPGAAVLVHRFEGPIGQFLGTHSYLMKGTQGQLALGAGDTFDVGSGPFARAHVISIDPVSQSASVQLCYGLTKVSPSVKITPSTSSSCRPAFVEGSYGTFTYKLANAACLPSYTVHWTVTGTTPAPIQPKGGASYSVLAPAPPTAVTITVTIVFDDGTSIGDSLQVHSVSVSDANLREFICRILQERKLPNPWWEFDPARLREITRDYSREQLRTVQQQAERIAETMGRIIETHR